MQVRLTGLPLYEDEGRHLLHLGVSGGWRNGTANYATRPTPATRLSCRPGPNCGTTTPPVAGARSSRTPTATGWSDTGVIASDSEYLMGLEALYIRGPFSFQAEYGWNWINNATGVVQNATSTGFVALPGGPQNYMFNGGYIQVAYTLTGENRAYDKRIGTLAREYFGKQGLQNAWIVRDEDGSLCWGRGAWEVAARYSYVDLNSGIGPDRIQGGIMDGVTLGLNWYLNNNLNCHVRLGLRQSLRPAHRHHARCRQHRRGLHERLRG